MVPKSRLSLKVTGPLLSWPLSCGTPCLRETNSVTSFKSLLKTHFFSLTILTDGICCDVINCNCNFVKHFVTLFLNGAKDKVIIIIIIIIVILV